MERLSRKLAANPSQPFRLLCGGEIPYLLKPCRVISLPVKGSR